MSTPNEKAPLSGQETRGSAGASQDSSSTSSGESSAAVQMKALLRGHDYDTQVQMLAPDRGQGGKADVQTAAAKGVSGSGGALPHGDQIQQSFGGYDISNVQAHLGSESAHANSAIGADAYARGSDIAFKSAPSLHTAAHEAAHVVQQKAGVQLSGGVGEVGDSYEKHADKVADAVVAGQSAEPILSEMAGPAANIEGAVQQKAVQRTTPPLTNTETPTTETPGAETPSTETPAAPPPPMTAVDAKTAIDGRIPGYADLSHAYAATLVGIQRTEFDAVHDNDAVLQFDVMRDFAKTGDARTATQTIGQSDPIAIQKFQDIDSEAHLEDPGLKATFYADLAAEMQKGYFQDRTRTFPAMQKAGNPAKFGFKGKPITPDRITPLSTRNQGVERLFDIITTDTHNRITTTIFDGMKAGGASDDEATAAAFDAGRRRKAYVYLLKAGLDPLATIDTSQPVSKYNTWYHPGAIVPSLNPDPNVAFTDMMTLGALQPEWYPDGTVVLDIDMSDVAGRVCRKPTALDGLMSSLWVARNMSENDYGLTGGGAGEFLEGKVTFANVTKARSVITTDDFQADLQALIAATPRNTTVTEEQLRGTGPAPRGDMASLYGTVVGATVKEQNTPGATPTIAGAPRERSTAAPSGKAVAPGGAYDRPTGP